MWTKKRTVHPHIRGAYALSGIAQVTDTRFIPTYVGHTAAPAPARPRCPVHPHIRGAYKPCRWWRRNEDGSSPHTWGILPVDINGRKKWRFIPTYVGHTPESCWFAVKDSVHPHIRGAYPVRGLEAEPRDGSSPHTWGILRMEAPQEAIRRFIPTYVGHTENPHRLLHIIPVHPHIRGAYLFVKGCPNWPAGSSPHTWGILDLAFQQSDKLRFIPTYVGHTMSECPNSTCISVHPHIRGAYWAKVTDAGTPYGSSPHTWGIRFRRG